MTYCMVLVVLLSVTSLRATGITRGGFTKFVKVNDNSSGAARLSPGWVDRSRLHCAANCQIRFSTQCRSFMYNKVTKLCTPAHDLVQFYPQHTVNEGDLYSCDSCPPHPKFSYHVDGSVRFSYYYETNFLNYTDATIFCNKLNSHLFAPDSLDKVAFFHSIIDRTFYTWIGLDDMDEEGKFVWANTGNMLDPYLKSVIFVPGQPDNNNNENCVHYMPSKLKFNDANCGATARFVCEKTMDQNFTLDFNLML